MKSFIDFLQQWDLLGFTIAAIISLLIGLLFKGIKNLISMKRKPYNISRQMISRTVYDNRNEGDFSITVSYKGALYDDSLTMLRIRLLNDGENDINFIRQCAKPITVIIDKSIEIVDIVIEPSNPEIEASIVNADGDYDVTWSLLKSEEFIDLVIVAKGKDINDEHVKMIVRAEGIEKIKRPEYRVWPQLWPVTSALILMALASWFLMPAKITFIPWMPENVFWSCFAIILIPIYVIIVLVKRIRWERE